MGRLLSKRVLCKPFGRWSGGGFEILHVGVKMAAGQRDETLGLKRPLVGSQGQVSDREDITKRNHLANDRDEIVPPHSFSLRSRRHSNTSPNGNVLCVTAVARPSPLWVDAVEKVF